MLNVVGCFVNEHDFRLVLLAACTCAIAAIATVKLLAHARARRGPVFLAWLAVTSVASGSGIWATHFIAMLAFEPGLPSGYDVGLTTLSLVLAIVMTGAGLAIATFGRAAPLGGAVVGVGVAVMHFTGMAAFEVAGRLSWDASLVAAAIAIGAAFGAAALTVALADSRLRTQLGASTLLMLAICGLHFTAMGAVTITPDPRVAAPAAALPTSWLAIAVALASTVILLLASAALALDVRERLRVAIERERLRNLANAAVEGLVICCNDRIVHANDNFARLTGRTTAELAGARLSAHFLMDAVARARDDCADRPVETQLRRRDGETISVELVARPIDFGAHPHFAIAVRDLTARLKAERHIHFLAHHDALTGLPNRTSFNERLDRAIVEAREGGGMLAVLCMDLDRFKEVNDLFGHAAGDMLLQNVARTVSDVLPKTHVMARLGGDEFAIFAPVTDAAAAGRLAKEIVDRLASMSQDASGLIAAASIGVSLFPDDADDRKTLLGNADIALYRAKSEGRGAFRFFETSMATEILDRRLLEHDLRFALSRRQIELVYQPQAMIDTGEIFGFEALARWTHPTRGAISPEVFIPLAEETGLILPIGEWVLREACEQAALWAKPLSVSVNVSAVQLHNLHFPQVVRSALETSGLPARRLELEITETALVRDLPRAVATLMRLKMLGVRIAMDDFGTGYSSLSNLRAFPFDKIKIDRSFVKAVDQNEHTAAIVRSVLGLGRGLGLPVLAEGVETEAEMRFLKDEQCHSAQGYLLGRPGPIEGFAHLTGAIVSDVGPAIATA